MEGKTYLSYKCFRFSDDTVDLIQMASPLHSWKKEGRFESSTSIRIRLERPSDDIKRDPNHSGILYRFTKITDL